MVENFNVEIVSPDRSILKTDAQEVSIPCFEGEMGILKDHIPIITFLRPGIIKVINAKAEPSLKDVVPGDTFQFQRKGYFTVDKKSKADNIVFNKTVGLRDSWKK